MQSGTKFANSNLDLSKLLFGGFSVVSFKRTKRLSFCHSKRKHFFSADVIKDEVGSTKPKLCWEFCPENLITSRWEMEKTILTNGHFFSISYTKTNPKLRVYFYCCNESL